MPSNQVLGGGAEKGRKVPLDISRRRCRLLKLGVCGGLLVELAQPPTLHLMFDFSLGDLLFGVPGLGSGLDTAFLGIQMSRAGLRVPGEEEVPRRPWSTFQDLKGVCQGAGEGLLARA